VITGLPGGGGNDEFVYTHLLDAGDTIIVYIDEAGMDNREDYGNYSPPFKK
jgi:hypothetical protein